MIGSRSGNCGPVKRAGALVAKRVKLHIMLLRPPCLTDPNSGGISPDSSMYLIAFSHDSIATSPVQRDDREHETGDAKQEPNDSDRLRQ